MYAKLNKMYQKGQAVITPKGIGRIININRRGSITLHELLNEDILSWYFAEDISPATEAEILAEAERKGWGLANNKDLFSPKKYHHVKKANSGKWYEHTKVEIDSNNLLPFCEEGLAAHTLITSLNLVK